MGNSREIRAFSTDLREESPFLGLCESSELERVRKLVKESLAIIWVS